MYVRFGGMVRVAVDGVSGALPSEVHQLLCGREIATVVSAGDSSRINEEEASLQSQIFGFARQMANYVYVVIDKGTRQACLVDPCWDVAGIVRVCKERLGIVDITCAVFTHSHFDHTGGRVPASLIGVKGVRIEGVSEVRKAGVKRVYIGEADADVVSRQTGLHRGALHRLQDGEIIHVGGSTFLETIHTPGHTPGSVCLMLRSGAEASTSTRSSVLMTGDTLFIGSCGRFDLPESDPRALLASLGRLSELDERCIVLPGHNYAMPSHTTIGQEKETNGMLLRAMELSKRSRVSGSTIRKSDTVAFVNLPAYIECARQAFHRGDATTSGAHGDTDCSCKL